MTWAIACLHDNIIIGHVFCFCMLQHTQSPAEVLGRLDQARQCSRR